MLDVVAEWARRLDQPSDDGAGGGMFIYAARHTTVATLVPVVQALIGLQGNSQAGQAPAQGSESGAGLGSAGAAARQPMAGAGKNVPAMSGPNGPIAVAPVGHFAVFQGEPPRRRASQGVLARPDQPARQVGNEKPLA